MFPTCFAPSLGLPHVVQQLDHLLVDDEDDGHVQTHSAQPGNRAFVEPGGDGVQVQSVTCSLMHVIDIEHIEPLNGKKMWVRITHACGPSCFNIWKAQSSVLLYL